MALDFLLTECDLAMTFLDVADNSAVADTVLRNRQNARKGYDTVLRFLPTLTLTESDNRNIQKKLGVLKGRLESVGELF